jgi:hypothetical protein
MVKRVYRVPAVQIGDAWYDYSLVEFLLRGAKNRDVPSWGSGSDQLWFSVKRELAVDPDQLQSLETGGFAVKDGEDWYATKKLAQFIEDAGGLPDREAAYSEEQTA